VLLALSWPDVTLFVVAVVFGAQLILFGVSSLWAAIRGHRTQTLTDERPSTVRRLARAGGAVVALVVALGLLAASIAIHRGEPRPDAFYDAPTEVPSRPGILLRSAPYTTAIPDSARAWRILYTTTRHDQTPALASAIVLVGRDAPTGPQPMIAWAHGTTGWERECAPSILDTGLASGALPALDRII
jgi:hypothetical protein